MTATHATVLEARQPMSAEASGSHNDLLGSREGAHGAGRNAEKNYP
jgi:hypothetical protein